MINRRHHQPRAARVRYDDALVFLLILAACLGVTYYLGNCPQEDAPPWSWETRLQILYGVLIWCGLILVPAVLVWLALAVRLLYELLLVAPYRRRGLLRHFGTFSLRWFGGAVLLVLVLPILVPCLLLFAPFWLIEQANTALKRYRQARAEKQLRTRTASRIPPPGEMA